MELGVVRSRYDRILTLARARDSITCPRGYPQSEARKPAQPQHVTLVSWQNGILVNNFESLTYIEVKVIPPMLMHGPRGRLRAASAFSV